ncbi:glycosyltransferase [Tolypothrix sp. PCC 7910]|uniref:glycosyltransferase n=1 Tax=Tolypothrix sp. PCC 7910 TaxID=2099387 RepID=UPI0014278CF6|nr:glycosyltransferase [Tolypothrix sp. PCC 7910]QIR38004.1 glycosyltransferase [Tolypothrix sp. PCC 7910]
MLKKLLRQKVFKFIVGGGIAAFINLLLIFALIEWIGFNTPTLRNIANALSIELSLLASFFIYRIWVWTGGAWTFREVLWRQIPLYHVSAGAAVIVRIFILFPLLDWLKVDYKINTLVGVLVSATLNYIISDRLVFKTSVKSSQRSAEVPSGIYYPEGLAPALENRSPLLRPLQPENSRKIKVFSIVIPAHNEEGCIVTTIQSISQILEAEKIAYEILVVNDNSRDRTEELLQQLNFQNSNVRYVNNYYPNGFGFAVRCGLENFQGDAVAIVMADSSDAPENIVDYYYKLQEGYDCVFGSRFIKGGKVLDYPTYKLIVNRLANLFIKILFGLKFNDTTNAFKAYRREVIDGISPLLSHHFNLTVEMPLKAIVRGYSYTTIPITWCNRQTGISKLKLKEMGSRYLFIVLYAWLEKYLSRGDYTRKHPQLIIQSKNQ